MGRYPNATSKEAAKEKHRAEHYEIGMELAKNANVQVTDVIAGADMEDLTTVCKVQLGMLLTGTVPKPSKIKNLTDVEKDLAECITEAGKAKYEADKAREAKEKAESNKKALDDNIAHLNTCVAATAASSAAAMVIPIAGPLIAAALAATAAGLKVKLEDEIRKRAARQEDVNKENSKYESKKTDADVKEENRKRKAI